MMRHPIVLSIAGFDPSSGAGITADIKTIAAHGCYGITCITALTVQSTRGVCAVAPVAPELIGSMLRELSSDVRPTAIKIGMLGGKQAAEAVADYLEENNRAKVVLDPVLRSSSGAELLDPAGIQVLVSRLLPRADVVTPNLDEAAALTGERVCTLAEMRTAASRFLGQGAKAVVVKGGHLSGEETVELLSYGRSENPTEQEFHGPRLKTSATHGTGCAFSSALACQLALGRELPEAVSLAKQYVFNAMQHAYELGTGRGPLNHLYNL